MSDNSKHFTIAMDLISFQFHQVVDGVHQHEWISLFPEDAKMIIEESIVGGETGLHAHIEDGKVFYKLTFRKDNPFTKDALERLSKYEGQEVLS